MNAGNEPSGLCNAPITCSWDGKPVIERWPNYSVVGLPCLSKRISTDIIDLRDQHRHQDTMTVGRIFSASDPLGLSHEKGKGLLTLTKPGTVIEI